VNTLIEQDSISKSVYRVGQKCTLLFLNKLCNKCVPIKLVLSDLSETHIVSHKYRIFFTIIKYSIC